MRLFLPLLVVVCAGCASAPEAGPSVAPQVLRFAWPVPSSATVVEEVEKDGHSASMRYRVTLSDHGDELQLKIHDMEFLSVAGDTVDTPDERAEAQQTLAAVGDIPALRISRDGRALGLADYATFVDRVVAMSADRPASEREGMAARMKDPTVQAGVEKKVAVFWRAWAESWRGEQVSAAARSATHDVDGVPATLTARLTETGEAQLTLTSSAPRETIVGQLRPMLQASWERMPTGERPARPDDLVEEAVASSTLSATLDPVTSLPRLAAWQSHTRVKGLGVAGVERAEAHRYTFSWGPTGSAAAPPGP